MCEDAPSLWTPHSCLVGLQEEAERAVPQAPHRPASPGALVQGDLPDTLTQNPKAVAGNV